MSVFTNPAGRAPEQAHAYVRALTELVGSSDPLAVMAELPAAVRRLTADLTPEEIRRPERPGKWSVVQVMEHLTDAEMVNGYRLRTMLADERPRLTGYDQDRWAERLRYGSAELETIIAELSVIRARNLRLWRSVEEHELARVGMHVERGEESVRLLRTLVAGHDLLHRRQLARIREALGKPKVSAP